MRNWFGQEIKVGDWVYRGAADRGGSVYKIGRVKTIKPGKNPRVDWVFVGRNNRLCSHVGSGNPGVDSLVVLDARSVDILGIVQTSLAEFREYPDSNDFFESYGIRRGDHFDRRWNDARLKFGELVAEYEDERDRFVNDRLKQNGYPPIY